MIPGRMKLTNQLTEKNIYKKFKGQILRRAIEVLLKLFPLAVALTIRKWFNL